MPNFNGERSYFSFSDTGGTTHDISAHLTEMDGLPQEFTLLEVTALGDSGQSHIRGIYTGAFSFGGYFDNTNTTGLEQLMITLRDQTTAGNFTYGPTGTSSGITPTNRIHRGLGWLRKYTVTSRVGNVIGFRCECETEGVWTFISASGN